MPFSSQLKLNRDPFARDGVSPLGPVRAAFEQLIRHVEEKTAIIVVAGPAGSGKTFLLDLTETACRERGMSVLRIERGDLAHTVIGKCADLLLVDEADFVDEATLNFLGGHPETPKTVVFACRNPRGVGDLALPTLVTLSPLTPNEARDFIVESATTAGRPDLFAPEALESLVAGTSGLPRLLRSIGTLALFSAAYEGASRVGAEHVAEALAAQIGNGQPLVKRGSLESQEANVSPLSQIADIAEEPEIQRDATHLVHEANVSPLSQIAAIAEEPDIRREPTHLVAYEAGVKFLKPLIAIIASSHKAGFRPKSFVKAKTFGAAMLPLLLLNGSIGEAGQYATRVNARMHFAPRLLSIGAMDALERVAKTEYPGRIILAVITTPPLQPVQIAVAKRTPDADNKQVDAAPKRQPTSGPQAKNAAKKNAPSTQRSALY